MASSSSSVSSRRQTFSLLESKVRAHLEQITTSSPPPSFPSIVESVTQFWDELGLDLDTPEGPVKDGAQQIIQRVIKEGALTAADAEVDTPKQDIFALYGSIKLTLDYSLAFSQIGKVEEKAPYWILEDVFAYLTVPGCRQVFKFLEERSTELKLPLPPALERMTGLALLRACNVLLARLSKSQDSVFCGRILSFMASAFSLGARSGVNLRGDFNIGNETIFEDVEEKKEEEVVEDEQPDVVEDVEMKDAKEEGEEAEEEEEGVVKDEIEEGETNEDSIPEVPKKEIKSIVEEKKEDLPSPVTTEPFYKTFWSLQAFFANPTLLSTPPLANAQPISSITSSGPSSFPDFQIRVNRVIATLAAETEKEKLLRGTGDGSASNGGGKGKDVKRDAVGGLDEVFMPKFLTSPGLLAFELADVSFRRQILVQFLILFQHLRTLFAAGGPGKITKTRVPNLVLDKQKERWFSSTWESVLKELRSTWPEGDKFTDTVLSILGREENWTRWKDHACIAFDLPPITDSSLIATREKRRRLEKAPPPPLANSVGTPALSKLWEKSILTELSQLEGNKPLDGLHVYSTKLARAELLASNRKRAYEKANGPGSLGSLPTNDEQVQRSEDLKSSLTFRGLRMASRTSIHLFQKFERSTSRQQYLSVLLDAEKKDKKEKEVLRELTEKAEKGGEPLPKVVVSGVPTEVVNGSWGGVVETEEMKEEEVHAGSVEAAVALAVAAGGEGEVAVSTSGDVDMA